MTASGRHCEAAGANSLHKPVSGGCGNLHSNLPTPTDHVNGKYYASERGTEETSGITAVLDALR